MEAMKSAARASSRANHFGYSDEALAIIGITTDSSAAAGSSLISALKLSAVAGDFGMVR
jgi:hypothetical protein